MTAGAALELLHGLKSGFYLDVGNETRRLMWTLAHAHGGVLSLMHLALASYVFAFGDVAADALKRASLLATFGIMAMPAGFFLGGLWHYGGDPGLGIFLVPAGAASMIAATLVLLRHAWSRRPDTGDSGADSMESPPWASSPRKQRKRK
jgi:hypothetical protein